MKKRTRCAECGKLIMHHTGQPVIVGMKALHKRCVSQYCMRHKNDEERQYRDKPESLIKPDRQTTYS